MASGKRTSIFEGLQKTFNSGTAANKTWKLVLDGGVRWNATCQMIVGALELRAPLTQYAMKLKLSGGADDVEVGKNDYLSNREWETLDLIRQQLEPIFRMTKSLEGNADLQDGACEASHGALWELLIGFDTLLEHFENLEVRAKDCEFDDHEGIQQSITLAWNQLKTYYKRTEQSIAWSAALVLNPRFKWKYFDNHWRGVPGLANTI